jgi:hypothetical protein
MVTRLREKAPAIEKALFEQIDTPERKWLSRHGGDIEEIPKVISAILEHCVSAIDGDRDRPPPPEAVTHARALARMGCGTDTLLERYIGCKVVFMEHLRQANLSVKPRSDAGFTKAQRRTEDFLLQLLKLVCKEHRAELQRRGRSRKDRELERVKQCLSPQMSYPPDDLGYDFSATHIGVVGSGPDVEGEILRLAQMLGGETLIVQPSPNQFWAWIGLKLQSSAEGLDEALGGEWSPRVRMGIGEPADGFPGWSCTHRQAQAAFGLTHGGRCSVLRYADVFLLACINQDDLPKVFLHKHVLEPLEGESDRGVALMSTLETYLAKDRQISSTAQALNVDRRTVRSRLDKIEARLGRSISAAVFEIEAALLLRQLRGC